MSIKLGVCVSTNQLPFDSVFIHPSTLSQFGVSCCDWIIISPYLNLSHFFFVQALPNLLIEADHVLVSESLYHQLSLTENNNPQFAKIRRVVPALIQATHIVLTPRKHSSNPILPDIFIKLNQRDNKKGFEEWMSSCGVSGLHYDTDELEEKTEFNLFTESVSRSFRNGIARIGCLVHVKLLGIFYFFETIDILCDQKECENKGHNININTIYKITSSTTFSLKNNSNNNNNNNNNIVNNSNLCFNNVYGMENEVVNLCKLIVTSLSTPKNHHRSIAKGILLNGVKGIGKTTIMNEVSHRLKNGYKIPKPISVCNISAYELISNTNNRVFSLASQSECSVVVIDDLDIIGNEKGELVEGEKTSVQKRIALSKLLQFLDGALNESEKLENKNAQICVVGVVRDLDSLHESLRRAGRFDHEVSLSPPNLEQRLEIVQSLFKATPLVSHDVINYIVNVTTGYVPSDLKKLYRTACLIARGKEITVEMVHTALTEVPPSTLDELHDFLNNETENVKWDDVGGYENVKQAIIESIEWPIKYAETFKRLGQNAPSGMVLHGKSGNGKTLMLRALKNSIKGVNFITIKGPELFSKYFGETERMIRKIMSRARKTPPCVIVIDELDSIGANRFDDDMKNDEGGSGVQKRVLSQLLNEIDGISEKGQVFILGCTNRLDLVDTALLRPGRLEKIIEVSYPNFHDRCEILMVHSKNMPFEKSVDWRKIAENTEHLTCAQIELICKEAGYNALRENKGVNVISEENLYDALNKFVT